MAIFADSNTLDIFWLSFLVKYPDIESKCILGSSNKRENITM